MGIYGMMRTGVAGMNAQGNKLSTVADNVANSSTAGYKRADTQFSSLVMTSGRNSYQSGGVNTHVRHDILQTGIGRPTQSQTDTMINGNGFFRVADSSGAEYMTRAGSFRKDAHGYIQNAQGFYLLDNEGQRVQFHTDAAGFIDGKKSQKIDLAMNLKASEAAMKWPLEPSSKINMNGNLDPNEKLLPTTDIELYMNLNKTTTAITDPFDPSNPATYNVSKKLAVSDDQGRKIDLNIYVTKTADDQWSLNILKPLGDTPPPTTFETLLSDAKLQFDDKGKLKDPIPNLDISVPDEDGNRFNVHLNLNFNSISQTIGSTTVFAAASRAVDPANPATYHHKETQQIFDKDGNAHNIDLLFTKMADNTWQLNAFLQPDAAAGRPEYTQVMSPYTIHFDEKGNIENPPTNLTATIPDNSGGNFDIQLNMGGMLVQKDEGYESHMNTDRFNPADSTTYHQKKSVTFYGEGGAELTADIYLSKTGNGEWEMNVYLPPDQTTTPPTYTPLLADFPLSFNASGKLSSPTSNPSITMPDANGPGLTVELNLADLITEQGGQYRFEITPDGRPGGYYDSFSFGKEGEIMLTYSNGNTYQYSTVGVTTVAAPEALTVLSGTVFQINGETGAQTFGHPGEMSFGKLSTGVLEDSNADIGNELTDMIEAQRSYTANSKVFQTGSEIIDVLINLKR